MKKSLLTVAMGAALGVASMQVSAVEFLDFTVDEGSVPNALDNVFVADKMNGSYSEVLTIDALGAFSTDAYVDFTSYLKDEGSVPVSSQVGPIFGSGGNAYSIYAIFTAAGTVTTTGFNGTSGLFELFVDVDEDTTKALPVTAAGSVVLGLNTDDIKLATATNVTYAQGALDPNGNGLPGSYRIIWDDFTLTTAADTNSTLSGETYFIEPNPFHMVVDVNGDFDPNVSVLSEGTLLVVGDVSAAFVKVPEPTSLALMGLGLLGLGAAARRKKA